MSLPICHSEKSTISSGRMPAIMKISCKDTSIYEVVVFVLGILFHHHPFWICVASYMLIFHTVLHVNPPKAGTALAICFSHLTVVSFYLGPCIYMYMTPSSSRPDQEQAVSVFCTVLTPMLNPFIYSLRNKDVLEAFQKVLRKHPVFKWTITYQVEKQLSRGQNKRLQEHLSDI